MMFKKRLLAMLLSGAMVLGMTACSGGGDTAQPDGADNAAQAGQGGDAAGKLKIGVALCSTTTEFWSAVVDGFNAAQADLGVEMTIVAPSSQTDVSGQVSQIEDLVTQDIDAIVVGPCDSTTVSQPLQAAIEKGIPIVILDSEVKDVQDCFVGTSNQEAAASSETILKETLGTGWNAVIIGGIQGHEAGNGRVAGFEDAMKACGANLLEMQYGDWTPEKAMDIMENFLQKYDNIDAVLCASDNTALGAMRAIQSSGKDIKIIGFDANESAVQEVINGNFLATISQDTYGIGYESLKAATQLANGEKVEDYVFVPTHLITKDNAEDFLAGTLS
ncbi:sugar ABC transporter substrate-binding protein [Intestinibacillus massiliensis]|nr:sugar ABC transporter substrate-binding protein [Intestinibacillus massiliensis]